MEMPNPIPDNPLRWDGWKHYISENPYERLCLSFEERPGALEIEDHCRRLLSWWQKKLPLKNQPSNPLSQLLRSGMDEAPVKLAEARVLLLDQDARAEIDARLATLAKRAAWEEFSKFLSFSLSGGEFAADAEESLYHLGENLGLDRPDIKGFINQELLKSGIKRAVTQKVAAKAQVKPAEPPPAPAPALAKASPREEFLRMLRLSGIDDITDDQRDAFCNMGEALGLTGGQAEDTIDEYLDERIFGGGAVPPSAKTGNPEAVAAPEKPFEPPAPPPPPAPAIFNSPERRTEEKRTFPDFVNSLGMPMLLVTSGAFQMGSSAPGAAPNEQPVSKVAISAFYLSRWPVTNAQYEQFDPAHRAKRAAWADEKHPVIYVSALDAAHFCEWLGTREKRRYRLPAEAEWEYAARGLDGRTFPWGERLDRGNLANFADLNKKLPWAHRAIDTGFSETSPVGSFPRGASPFGIEEMAGNVWEWCLDCLSTYQAKERSNPRGSLEGGQRIYRGGSWKSRIGSLRASTRNFNSPVYSANDIGFRVLCEVK